MATSAQEKDQGVVRHTSAAATLDDVVSAIKHLSQTLENMDKQNRTRLDAIENTNYTMLKAIYSFVKQDQNESLKDAMDDVAMSGTQNTCVNDQTLSCQNPKKPMSTPTVRSTKNEAYSKSKATLNNIETIFIPGDDDDEFMKPLPMGMKGSKTTYSSLRTINLSGPNQVNTTDDSSPLEPFMSNYVTGLTAKNNKETLMAPRKLSFPQHSYWTSKKPKIEQHSQPSNAKKIQQSRGSSSGNISNNNPSRIFHRTRTNSSRGYTHTIPKDMPYCFKPTVDMNLTFEETQVCAYVFNPNLDPRLLTANYTAPGVFGVCHQPLRYTIVYMIYIPIVQNSAHWYLMVIDINDRKIYHLDCDLTSETEYDRKDTIKIMANVMLSVLEIVFPTQEFVIGFDGMDCWDIVEARGIPNGGSRDSDLSHGDELSFYCRIYDKIWEMVIRRKINWDR
ncbi:hypothetical protein JHK82_040167 [Glycine max]|nr:hypothetical protein JHK82_040167 [Glycine max]KAG5122235.1 hypothetical protein JHK84_040575 [Glycine max]